MTREINGRIVMRVSDDGTRCAAECPHRTEPRDTDGFADVVFCRANGNDDLALDDDGGPLRHPACIAAEQAAAPLACTCATMARDPRVPGWQMCPRCTVVHDGMVDARAQARVEAAASVPSCEADEHSFTGWDDDADEPATTAAPSCEDYIGGYIFDPAQLDAYHHGMQTVAAVIRKILDGGADYRTHVVEAIGRESDDHLDGGARALDASEALREARVQGMREGLSITKGHACAYADGSEIAGDEIEVDYEDADEALEAAIEAVRKGER